MNFYNTFGGLNCAKNGFWRVCSLSQCPCDVFSSSIYIKAGQDRKTVCYGIKQRNKTNYDYKCLSTDVHNDIVILSPEYAYTTHELFFDADDDVAPDRTEHSLCQLSGGKKRQRTGVLCRGQAPIHFHQTWVTPMFYIQYSFVLRQYKISNEFHWLDFIIQVTEIMFWEASMHNTKRPRRCFWCQIGWNVIWDSFERSSGYSTDHSFN